MSGGWRRGRGPIAAIVAVCFVLYLGYDLLRFSTYHAPAYDLGFFDQLTSSLSSGRGWSSSFITYDFRGQHWEPILLVWAQLYRLVQSPIWLLLISSIALALAPLAAWRLGRCWFGPNHPAALVAALATALSPLVLRTVSFDYHSETLTPVLTLLALEAACRRRWLAVAAACAWLVLLKEDAFLVVAGIGWLVWRAEKRRGGLIISAAAVAGFAVVVGVYMPAVRGIRPSDLVARYAYLGSGGHAKDVVQIAAGMVARPGTWVAHLLSTAPLEGLAVAFLPLALLPLLSGTALAAVLPPLAVALLSADHLQSSLQLHYGIEVFPLLLACAMLGWRRAERWQWLRRPAIRRNAGIAAVALVLLTLPLTINVATGARDVSGGARTAAVQTVLDMVPAGAAVAASTDLVAHLSDRPAVTEFPDVRSARWVVIDELGAPSSFALAAGYRSAAARLSSSFHVVARGGGVVLWERT